MFCSKELTLSSPPAPATARISGVSHVALVTNNMDATVRFYVGILGLHLDRMMSHEGARHYVFRCGSTRIAFLERAGMAIPGKSEGLQVTDRVRLDHLALAVPDLQALFALQARLRGHSCSVGDVVERGRGRSVYFTDNNGITLEATWNPALA